MTLNERIERLEDDILKQETILLEKRRIIEDCNEMLVELEDAGFKTHLSAENNFTITISDVYDLTTVRRILRAGMGGWRDTFGTVWHCIGSALASWDGDVYPISIWLDTTVELFPTELLPTKGCEWKKIKEENYHLVCPVSP